MNPLKLGLLALSLLLPSAQAGGAGPRPAPTAADAPAREDAFAVYDAAAKLLSEHYAGPKMGEVAELTRLGRQDLARACAGLTPCPVVKGVEATRALLKQRLGDRHAGLVWPFDLLDGNDLPAGSVSTFGLIAEPLKSGLLAVVYVKPESAAASAGIAVGDVLVLTREQLKDVEFAGTLWKAPAQDSKVTLRVRRSGQERTVELQSQQGSLAAYATLRWHGEDAVLALPLLTATTSQVVDEKLEEVCQKKANRLILDLRFNGGGLYSEMAFVGKALGIRTLELVQVDRQGRTYKPDYAAVRHTPPQGCWNRLTVLVGPWTASAGEVLALWLQREGHTVYGAKTFGVLSGGLTYFKITGPARLTFTTVRNTLDGKIPLPDFVTPDVPTDLDIRPEGTDPLNELLRSGF